MQGVILCAVDGRKKMTVLGVMAGRVTSCSQSKVRCRVQGSLESDSDHVLEVGSGPLPPSCCRGSIAMGGALITESVSRGGVGVARVPLFSSCYDSESLCFSESHILHLGIVPVSLGYREN